MTPELPVPDLPVPDLPVPLVPVLVAALVGLAVLLALPGPRRLPGSGSAGARSSPAGVIAGPGIGGTGGPGAGGVAGPGAGGMGGPGAGGIAGPGAGTGAAPARWRLPVAGLAGAGVGLFIGGPPGVVAGLLAWAGCWLALVRAEPTAVRREREGVARDLPHVVDLLAAVLRSGAAPVQALRTVCLACPGPVAVHLEGLLTRLGLGADAAEVWRTLESHPVLAPLGRTLARAEASGASVADAVERLADELESEALAAVEDRARAVGVKAALPLGLCLLPAFLLIGIVPTVAGLLATLRP